MRTSKRSPVQHKEHKSEGDEGDEGVDVVTVAILMGHKSLDTTALYTQPSEEDMVEAAEKLSVR